MHKTVRTCERLLEEYRGNESSKNSSKLNLILPQGDARDVYNISAPFVWNGKTVIAGRVEERDSESSEIYFFEKEGDDFRTMTQIEPLKLQDPFFTMVNEELVVGGVEVYPDEKDTTKLAWRTVFYRGCTLENLKRFAKGPDRMKDIRLKQLPDQRILVFTRPQGALGGRGKIGYILLDSLQELNEENLLHATILQNQFLEEEWGGANEIHILRNGRIGVLSHIACFDEQGDRHYYATAFGFDYTDGSYTPMKMIAERRDFANGPAKRPDLKDVIFSGGLVRQENARATLYCGVSDAEAYSLEMEDPFLSWEDGKEGLFK